MGNCATSKSPSKNSKAKHQIMQFIKSRLLTQQLEMLNLIYNDLAERIPQKQVNIQNFLLFFHKTGQWGDRLFKQFDCNQSNLICIEQFVKGIAKIFKTQEKQKIRLLFSFFSSNGNNTIEGIAFNQLLTMLYNYPKEGLKKILNDQEFVDHQIKKRLIEVKQNRRLQSIYNGAVNINNNNNLQFQYEQSQTGSERMESAYGFKEVLKKLKKPQHDEGTTFRINIQGKSVQVKSNNIHHLIKKFARNIFRENNLSIQRGRLSSAQFEKWVEKHKQLYTTYYDGFHNEVWQFDQVNKKPKYALTKVQKASPAKMLQFGVIEDIYLLLLHSTIIVTKSNEHDVPINTIILDGLAVVKCFEKQNGFGIEISHRDGYYAVKKFFFKNQNVRGEWLQVLKYYKGTSIQQHYDIGRQIGTGKFSVVYQGRQHLTGIKYAVKVIDNQKLQAEAKILIAHQSNIMSVLSHPFLVYHKETISTKTQLYIITQLVKGKDLFEYIRIHERLSEIQTAKIIRKLIIGVKYMHEMGIIHRDLKPQNVMIIEATENQQEGVKIIDFGFSNYISRLKQCKSQQLLAGTPGYIAPQILLNEELTFKVDNFAIGAIIFFMLSGSVPFNGYTIQQMFQKTLDGAYNFNDRVWRNISMQAKDFIDKLLCPDPEDRLELNQALYHPWFKKTNTQS